MSTDESFEFWFSEYKKHQSANAELMKGPLKTAYMQGFYDGYMNGFQKETVTELGIDYEVIQEAAKVIIKHVKTREDMFHVGTILAELEPYPEYVLTIEKVP